jgi:hypothetical protein
MKRRHFAFATVLGVPALISSPMVTARKKAAPAKAQMYEATLIKAAAEKKQRLIQFIQRNWFAMDAIAVREGLMSSYKLFDNQNAQADWDLLVLVGYPKPEGYEGIRNEFEKIRQNHVTIPVDGLEFKQMGQVIRSERWREHHV